MVELLAAGHALAVAVAVVVVAGASASAFAGLNFGLRGEMGLLVE